MDSNLPAPARDPEFAAFGENLLRGDLGDQPEQYLRLVANPFLAFLFVVGWLALLYKTAVEGFAGPLTPMMVVLLVASLFVLPRLIHCHCLDCGRTATLPRWRKHTCEAAVARRDGGRRRLVRGPSPPYQVAIWVWVVLILGVLARGALFER